MKELVSISERRWIAEHAVIEMGSKIKYKVMDIDKVISKIAEDRKSESMTPWVEIQPISEDMHKNRNNLTAFQKDPITGVYYGIAVGEDDFGNIRWQKIQLTDHMSLNLDKRDDAKIWAVIRFHPSIKGSPWQDQNPYYKIFDPIEQARVERGEIEMMKLAFDRIDKILNEPKAMVNFARYLGEELMENSNYEIVRGRLLSVARNHPYTFNQKWEDKTRSYGEYFESARALGIITNEADRGFIYKGIGLGFSSTEAIKYLSQDTSIMTAISNELADNDIVIKNVSKTIKSFLAKETNKKKEDEDFS
jgi:hypothetical protein